MSTFLDAIARLHETKEKEKAVYKDETTSLVKATQNWMDSLPPQPTETNYLRASGLHGVCPKEFVLNYWQPRPNRFFDWKSRIMMDVGSSLHYQLQNQILGPMGVLYGNWKGPKVLGFDTHFTDCFYPDPEKAIWEMQHQMPLSYIYQEYEVWDEQYRIKGHVDGKISLNRLTYLHDIGDMFKGNIKELYRRLQKIPAGELVNWELKSSGGYVFDKITGEESIPDYYRSQACIYQAKTGIYKTLFWYINRDTMKSKTMIYNYEKHFWTEATRKARIIWEAIRDERLPDAMLACKSPKDDRAKGCTFCEPCFGRRLDFKKYVEDGKRRAAEEGRMLLDLTGLRFPE